ncbi:phospholipid-binding protein MlaC [Amaricoccus sp. W119]|uniref:MlaC/ttg2D family ABC transporter substrate-binding protein n=1 Tax=Amaricoccus sp. W119 TaxID=3391833 RepID=UPI0039A64EB3
MTMNDAALSRRALMRGAAGLGLAFALHGPAFAQSTSAAQQLVVTLSNELSRLVNSGQSANQIISAFQQLLMRYGDMNAVSASVVGPTWRGASPAQKQAFVPAFTNYFAKRYGKTFSEYKNATIQVDGAQDAGRAGVLVNSTVKRPGQEDIRVGWQISDRSGSPKVVNLVIEGVSALANERAEVGAMLDAQGGDLDRLIAQMRSS